VRKDVKFLVRIIEFVHKKMSNNNDESNKKKAKMMGNHEDNGKLRWF
jgi:hypothetical protein